MKLKIKFGVGIITLLMLFSIMPTKVLAAADTVELTKQRTILWNFSNCIVREGDRDSSVIDTKRGHFGASDDAIGNWMDDKNYVVGFDVEPGNGVTSCLIIIQLGINTLIDRGVNIPQNMGKFAAPNSSNDVDQKTNVTEWLGKYVVNKTFDEMGGQNVNYDRSVFQNKLKDLKNFSEAEIAKIGRDSVAMVQRRYYNLFNICYRSEATAKGVINGDKGDFIGTDGRYYYIKSIEEIKPLIIGTFITDGGDDISPGSNHNYRMDDIILNFHSFRSTVLNADTFDPKTSDFYPIGGDVAPFNEAGVEKGIADCQTIKNSVDIQNAILSSGVDINNGQLVYNAGNPNAQNAIATPNADNPLAAEEPSCETSGFELAWVTCGVINGMTGVVQGIFTTVIEPYLRTSPVDLTSSDNSVFKVWSAMRNLANIILIFALLFVVFGQSVGGGMVDAYTAKKIVPRILIAAILINISIYFVAALIDIFNILGAGAGNLILTPFKDMLKFNGGETGGDKVAMGTILAAIVVGILGWISINAFSNPGTSTGITGATTGQAAAFTVGPFLHFFLVFILLPAVLITLAIFVTLIIRQGLILILIVTAPIAFALFALPSTEKYFTKWRETFVATLMVYPIMSILFATSIIMASISFNVGDSTNAPLADVIGAIVALIILFVPLALIPFSFKIAGGLIGNIMNTSKGLGSRFAGSPQNKYKEAKALERKMIYEQKAADPNSFQNRRIAAKTQGRRTAAVKRQSWISGARNAGSPQDETDADSNAAGAASAGGANPAAAAAAGAAARGSYKGHKRALTNPDGSWSGPHDQAAASVGGSVAGAATAHGGYTPAQVAGASNASVATYRTSAAAGFTHEESTAAANASADAVLAGRSQQATTMAGRMAADAYKKQAAAPSMASLSQQQKHVIASGAASAVGQSAASGYDESMRRNSGNTTTATTHAQDISDTASALFEKNLSTNSPEAAGTAAIASGDAYFGSSSPIGSAAHTFSVENAADAAANAHDNAVLTGTTDPTQARAAGRQAGQTHW